MWKILVWLTENIKKQLHLKIWLDIFSKKRSKLSIKKLKDCTDNEIIELIIGMRKNEAEELLQKLFPYSKITLHTFSNGDADLRIGLRHIAVRANFVQKLYKSKKR